MTIIDKRVEEIKPGKLYWGYIEIDDKIKIEYQLDFVLSISELVEKFKSFGDVWEYPEVRQIIRITLKNRKELIELDDDEYLFFFHLIVEFAILCYADTDKFCYMFSMNPSFPTKVTKFNCVRGKGELSEEARKILTAPKFGLVLD